MHRGTRMSHSRTELSQEAVTMCRAVGAERRTADDSRVADERQPDLRAGLDIPQPRGLVRRSGDDAFAVGAEGGAGHIIGVTGEHVKHVAGCRIPQPRRFVPGRCDDQPAVGAERRAGHAIAMAAEHADWLAGVDKPNESRGIVRRCDDALAIGAEGGAVHMKRAARIRYGESAYPKRRPIAARSRRSEAVTMRLPSGLNAALDTTSLWPSSTMIC